MEDSWNIIKAVAGSFVIVYGLKGVWYIAKQFGKREYVKELTNNGVHIQKGVEGEKVIISVNGEEYYLGLEPVK